MMEPKLSSDQIIKAAKCFCRKGVRPFKTHAQILEASGRLFELRAQLGKIDDNTTYKTALCVEKEATANLHKNIDRSLSSLNIVRIFKKCRLNRTEKEVLLLLALSALGMLDHANDLDGIQRIMNKKGRDAFAIAEALAEDGRLVSHELITINDDIIPTVKGVQASSEFISLLLSKKKVYSNQRDIETNSDNHCESAKSAAVNSDKILSQQKQFRETDNPENTTGSARRPLLKPEQLVLSDKVSNALEMCVVQAQNADTMFDDWGLRETIPYGEAVVMMFSGPAGTGKTASAEAIAYQLNKPIMVVNYAEVQNYLAGQTQKNIVRIFAEAEETNAVLFWDEADSFFCDRDSACQNWEVREINVLLQELEKFHGVCILSTNRRDALDKALERRINIKVQFERPDKNSRRQIWEKLTPVKMPLAEDVSFDKLSGEDLSGGEIKNVVLNAARLAIKNGRKNGPVMMDDFQQAIQIENEGRWNVVAGKFGFNK